MTVEAAPSTVQGITALRSVLDALLERAVLGQSAARSSDRVVRAFRRVRTLMLLKVRLLHLLNCSSDGAVPTVPVQPNNSSIRLKSGLSASCKACE